MENKESKWTGVKNSLFLVLMFIPTMIVSFFVLLAAKMTGKRDWSV